MPEDRDHPPTGTSRRRVLVGGALAAGAVAVPLPLLTRGALAQASTGTTAPKTIAEAPSDVPLAVFARGVSYAAAEVYTRMFAVADGLPAGMLPDLHVFHIQHIDAANTWSGIAGLPGDTTPLLRFIDPLRLDILGAENESERIRVLYDTEQAVVGTMLLALRSFSSLDGAMTAAGILSSSARRATVLGSSLELDLDEFVPTFESTDDAIEEGS